MHFPNTPTPSQAQDIDYNAKLDQLRAFYFVIKPDRAQAVPRSSANTHSEHARMFAEISFDLYRFSVLFVRILGMGRVR